MYTNLMGDYGLGINTSDRALSPVDFNQLNSNQSLFSPSSLSTKQTTMQDDTLHIGEQSAAVKQQQQQMSPNNSAENGREDTLGDDSLGIKSKNDPQQQQNGQPHEEKKNNVTDSVNSVITSLNQLGLSEPNNTVISSLASTVPSFWSTATTDDTFIQGFPAVNGAVTFPNFPPGANPLFNTNVAPQLPQQLGLGPGPLPQQATAHQRRAITGQTAAGFPQQRGPAQQQQANMFLNNTKTYPTWSSAPQQSTWSQQQQQQQQQTQNAALNPWASMQQQQQQQQQRRAAAMPPNVGPIGAPGKKPNMPTSSMMVSPSKYRMPTPGMGGGKAGLDFGSGGGMDDHRDASGILGMQQVR